MEKLKILGSSLTSPIDNTQRKEVRLRGRVSEDFVVTARCRIMKVGSRVAMSAADLPGDLPGTFHWSTHSSKIKLENSSGNQIFVGALDTPGTDRDSETITVTRTAHDGSKKSKTVSITVAKVTFSASANQMYGFDDYDTPYEDADNHLSVMSTGHTFVAVHIEGGADSSDFEFNTANPKICTATPPPATTKFDLRIDAGEHVKASTTLSATVRCLSKEVFATLSIHVYEEFVAKVVIAKFSDFGRPGTALRWPDIDYAAHGVEANKYLKDAVARLEMENLNGQNRVTHIDFKGAAGDALVYDMGNDGGPMVKVFDKLLESFAETHYRVIVVKKIDFAYFLGNTALAGSTTVTIAGSTFIAGKTVEIGDGVTKESVLVKFVDGNIGILATPLKFTHQPGTIIRYPAQGIAGSGLMFVQEEHAEKDSLKWVVVHEVVHRALDLRDIVDETNMMHYVNAFKDYRLRYCPRTLKRSQGTQNQWDSVPRE
ncbi:hypothetical protein KY495_18695 [Massilia sp. PAMC28688]|uniref:hypothetical protein n=1 Tax=Massilia sp. PAMC28688 TaxID=2861283 RepID=UPI001C63A964|nr:hypothetical protein [Massilia sp. PAMC28688]QYF92739.1 hypothetical protein KY495_18695 [Massilia sp. PAMC28688]